MRLIVSALVFAMGGCRSTDICGSSSALCDLVLPVNDAGASGSAGTGAQAGSAGIATGNGGSDSTNMGGSSAGLSGESGIAGAAPLTCSAPLANCDETALNGCESNLSFHGEHCGSCNTVCEGACLNSVCQFNVIPGVRVDPASRLAVSEDYLYFLDEGSSDPQHLKRVDLLGKGIETFAEDVDGGELAVGPDRIYLWSDWGDVSSVHKTTRERVDEQIPNVVAFAVGRGWLYWAKYADGTLYRRRENGSAVEKWQWPAHAGGSYSLRSLHANDDTLFIVHTKDNDEGVALEYAVSELSLASEVTDVPVAVATTEGSVFRARAAKKGLFWLVKRTVDGRTVHELRQAKTRSSPERVLAAAEEIHDFAVDEDYAYITLAGPGFPRIHAISLENPQRTHTMGVRFRPFAMEALNYYLWYFDPEWGRLLRVDLESLHPHLER